MCLYTAQFFRKCWNISFSFRTCGQTGRQSQNETDVNINQIKSTLIPNNSLHPRKYRFIKILAFLWWYTQGKKGKIQQNWSILEENLGIYSVKLPTVVMQRQRRKCKIILVSTYSNFIAKRKLEEKYRRLIVDLYLWKRLEKKSVRGNSGLRLFVSDRNTMPTSHRLNIQFRNVILIFFLNLNSRALYETLGSVIYQTLLLVLLLIFWQSPSLVHSRFVDLQKETNMSIGSLLYKYLINTWWTLRWIFQRVGFSEMFALWVSFHAANP